ncbi:MAG: biotin/lipoyl-binding protein [Planctomycetaceae bacterium]|nr:biotin/lipoyl-binding protein [Planctomycetaceae bacterium]
MLTGATAPSLQGSSQRPIPLRARRDLLVERMLYRGVHWHVVKDPCAMQYYRLQPEQFTTLQLLDGRRSLEDLRDALQRAHATVHVSLQDVQLLINDLHEKRLLVSERLGQGFSLIKQRRTQFWKKAWQTVRNPLYLKLPGWDPDRTLTRMLPLARLLFHPLTLAIATAVVLASWMFLAVRFDDVRRRLPEFQQFFAWPNLLYLWLTMAATKVLHEFGHGLSCKYFGRESHAMGVMLLVFSPTLYCDVTDAWMIRNKWPRIAIGAAGMCVEVFLAAIAIFVWWHTQNGVIQHLCLNVFFVSTVTTVIFNINPLLRFDGYYMLADYLEIPNLQQKASRLLQHTFAWYCLGIELPEDAFTPRTGRGLFVLYCIASAIYRWVVLFGIALFLYTVLKPYRLQSIGITLAVISVGSVIGNLIWNVVRLLRMPRSEPLSRPKIVLTLVTVAVVIGGGLLIPFPWYLAAPFYVEPVGVQHVYATVPGTIAEIHAEPGGRVDAGDVLVTLHSPELDDQFARLERQRDVQQVEVEVYRSSGDPDRQSVAQQRLTTIGEQLADLELQRSQLVVRAPITGTVIAAPRAPEPKLDAVRQELPRWSGTPLDRENRGCTLDEQTHVCSIAPGETYQAVLVIDQGDRADIPVDTRVRMKIEELPDVVLDGTVADLSVRHFEFVPPALSNKHGGPLPTVTDARGREQATSHVYEGTVVLSADPQLLRTGMRGESRLIVGHRSAAEWLWRWLRATFKFRL